MPASRVRLRDGTLALLDPPEAGTLTVHSRIAPARNASLEGLYVSSGVFCTQCEPEGFRRITYFPDRPDVLARYTVTLRADRAAFPVLLSNGNLIAQGVLDDGRHYATWHDPFPKPSYLFALVAGELEALEDTFTTMSGRPVALKIYSTPANLPRCRHAMTSIKRAFRWDEERFGREYDLDAFMIFCADDFNMGAMENKGLNIFNSRLVLADPATATDDDYAAIEAVVGHEYFHNWTGNRVTCRDWFQLSLKEGLTVFRDQEFSSDHEFARRRAHRRRRISAARAVSRGRGADGAQRPTRRIPRDQQFLHGHRVRKGRRSHPDAAHAARRPSVSAAAWTFTSTATTAWPSPATTSSQAMVDASQRRPRAIQALVQPGRHAGGHGARHARCRRADLHARRRRSTRPPRRGNR